MKNFIKKTFLFLKPGGFEYFIFILHTYFLIRSFFSDGTILFTETFADSFAVFFSYFTLLIWLKLLSAVFVRHRILHTAAALSTLLWYAVAASYFFETKSYLDFDLFRDNFFSAFTLESLPVMLSAFKMDALAGAAVLISACIFFEIKMRFISRHHPPRGRAVAASVILSALWFFMLTGPVASVDPFHAFFREVWKSYTSPEFDLKDRKPWMWMQADIDRRLALTDKKNLPDVYIIAVESYNGLVFGAKTADGKEITPQLNRLARNYFTVPVFYGNSIQTAKGHHAILTSMYPAKHGKETLKYLNVKLRNLASVFLESGYETVFFQGHSRKKFDGINDWVLRNGFNSHQRAADYLQPEDASENWGWGPEDGLLYRRFFDFLDQVRSTNSGKPVFAFIATINNHMHFDVPPARRMMYKNPSHLEQAYANSISLSDSQLPVFFNELKHHGREKNSIVVITGDHSFPLGQHGYTQNELGFYEDSFRTPLVICDLRITPRLRGRFPYAASQLDIAPTLADLAGVSAGTNSWRGRSLLLEPVERPVLLVQPYSGKYLQAVMSHIKYIRHERTGKEYLFDLKNDPDEKTNLRSDRPQLLEKMRPLILDLEIAQKLYDINGFLPARN